MEASLATNTGLKRLESLVASALAYAAAMLGLIASGMSARAVVTSIPAYTYANGTITLNAAGSITADGVTLAVGDQCILPAGIATANADEGLYVVVNIGGAVPAVMRRVAPLLHGAKVAPYHVNVGGEGTIFKNTVWQAFASAATLTIGTTDPKLFPQMLQGKQALVGGTFTIGAGGVAGTFAPILDANTQVNLTRVVANTTAATVMYAATSAGADGRTPGGLGTGALVVQAVVAAGTINNADISTLQWQIVNQA